MNKKQKKYTVRRKNGTTLLPSIFLIYNQINKKLWFYFSVLCINEFVFFNLRPYPENSLAYSDEAVQNRLIKTTSEREKSIARRYIHYTVCTSKIHG